MARRYSRREHLPRNTWTGFVNGKGLVLLTAVKLIVIRLMREPRGHDEMYGAILIPTTELTERNEADIGVLFCHNGKFVSGTTGCYKSLKPAARGLLDNVWACDHRTRSFSG